MLIDCQDNPQYMAVFRFPKKSELSNIRKLESEFVLLKL